MKVTAVICEYNPFHNGHEYQLKKAKELTGADFIVVVMSGNFVQRGEPAIVNKWSRAEMALYGGADLVIELPVPYAISSAEYFAMGAVKLLNRTGVVDYLCFGSELGEISLLKDIAQILVDESDDFKKHLRESLDSGLSYAAARANALPFELRKIASSPNNILGIEYLKALMRTNSTIEPITLQRIGAGYNNVDLNGEFSSATSIRQSLQSLQILPSLQKDLVPNKISKCVPPTTLCILNREFLAQRGPVFTNSLFENLRYKIRSLKTTEIKEYPGVTEGLETRIKKAFDSAHSFEEAISLIKSKRYPTTRIYRSLLSIYLGLDAQQLALFYETGPTYLRILGMKESARILLKQIKNVGTMKISMKLKNLVENQQKSISDLAITEMLSTNLYVLNYPKQSTFKGCGQEFLSNPIIIER